jgi:mitochondrial import inner membrane translocase subunit TIM21
MLLNFYVQANPHSPDQDVSYFDSASPWLHKTLSEISWQEARDWIVLQSRETVEYATDLFRYLSGDPVSSKSGTSWASLPVPQKQEIKSGDRKGFWENFTGLFGSLRGGGRKGPYEGTLNAGDGRVWQEGEVHADLVRVGVQQEFSGTPGLDISGRQRILCLSICPY